MNKKVAFLFFLWFSLCLVNSCGTCPIAKMYEIYFLATHCETQEINYCSSKSKNDSTLFIGQEKECFTIKQIIDYQSKYIKDITYHDFLPNYSKSYATPACDLDMFKIGNPLNEFVLFQYDFNSENWQNVSPQFLYKYRNQGSLIELDSFRLTPMTYKEGMEFDFYFEPKEEYVFPDSTKYKIESHLKSGKVLVSETLKVYFRE
jgi:hypothetical protein